MGNRGDGTDGVFDQQLIGIIGQNVLNYAINGKYIQPSARHDGGVDVIIHQKLFDIKTMGRTTKPELNFVNNFTASQSVFNVDGYIFTSLNKTNMRISICGWIPKSDLEKKANFYEKGKERTRRDGSSFYLKADTYEIENSKLFHGAESFPELFSEIKTWADEGSRN